MIYELRRYECLSLKLPVLQEMMDKMAVPCFARHGMKLVGAWTVAVGERENALIYILAFDSMDDRMRKWAAFHKDPEWNEQKRKVHEKEGALTHLISNSFLIPQPYSPLQ